MSQNTQKNYSQSILSVETGNRAMDSTNLDEHRQHAGHQRSVGKVRYHLPSVQQQQCFGPGVPRHERPGPSADSLPWVEHEGIPMQHAGHQAGHSSSRSFNTQCYGPHVWEEGPRSHYQPQQFLVEPPVQRHHYLAPNSG